MPDRYQQLVNTPLGRIVSKQIGLPRPMPLERYKEPGQPPISGPVLVGAAPDGRLHEAVRRVLEDVRAEVAVRGTHEEETFRALVFDASGIADSAALKELWAFFHPTIRRVRPSGRLIVLGTPPEQCADPAEAIAQRALEGFVRSMGKEARGG